MSQRKLQYQLSKGIVNNVCIQKIAVSCCGGTAIKYIAVCRYNYTPVELSPEFHSLSEAVKKGKKIAEEKNIKLCCSCSLTGRAETAGLEMF